MNKNTYSVIKISGGLGNQLFQYLFGIANFQGDHANLVFDISECFNPANPRRFVLDQLGLSGNFAVGNYRTYYLNDIEHICLDNIEWRASTPFFDKPKKIDCRVFREEQFNHANPPEGVNAYFWGYWQTPEAWPKEESVIPLAYERMLNSPLMDQVHQLLASTISNDEKTCAIHVRGEDYLGLLDYHGICSAAYFESSISKFPDYKFHVYTNDVEYAKRVLPKNYDYVFVNKLIDDDLLEFLLLTKYSSYIISNSSYSYLAASISCAQSVGVQVVAPYPWFSFVKEGPQLGISWQLINRTTGYTFEEDQALIRNIKVSVIIAVHKRPEYLEPMLKSVLSQTRLPYEIIFSQNAASDEVKNEVVRLSKISPLIKVVSSDRPSLSLARNRGIEAAKGDLLAFLDDDDIWVNNKLEIQVKNLILMGASAVSSNYYEFDDQENIHNTSSFSLPGSKSWVQLLGDQNFFSGGSAVMVRSEVFGRTGHFDEAMPTCEDHDMWFRMALNGERLVFLSDVLLGIRKNGKNMSSNERQMLRGGLIFFSKLLAYNGVAEQIIKDCALRMAHISNLVLFPENVHRSIEYPANLYKATITYWHLRHLKHYLKTKLHSYGKSLQRRGASNKAQIIFGNAGVILCLYCIRSLFVLLVCIPVELIIYIFHKLRKPNLF